MRLNTHYTELFFWWCFPAIMCLWLTSHSSQFFPAIMCRARQASLRFPAQNAGTVLSRPSFYETCFLLSDKDGSNLFFGTYHCQVLCFTIFLNVSKTIFRFHDGNILNGNSEIMRKNNSKCRRWYYIETVQYSSWAYSLLIERANRSCLCQYDLLISRINFFFEVFASLINKCDSTYNAHTLE